MEEQPGQAAITTFARKSANLDCQGEEKRNPQMIPSAAAVRQPLSQPRPQPRSPDVGQFPGPLPALRHPPEPLRSQPGTATAPCSKVTRLERHKLYN